MSVLTTSRPVVLHVLEALEGGTARHLSDVVRHVRGVEHHVAMPRRRGGYETDFGAARAIRDAGGGVHYVEMRRNPLNPLNGRAIVALRRLVKALHPSVIHGHSAVGGALARAAAWHSGIARVYTPHALSPNRLAIACERFLGRSTDRVIAVSNSERAQVLSLGIVPAHRAVTISNGIERPGSAERTGPDVRALLSIAPSSPLVGTIARLIPQKAPLDFVRACARLMTSTNAHFLLVGMGPLERRIDHEISSLEFGGRFHRLAHLPAAETWIGQLDVFVLTSRFEGLPYAALEACREGAAVVLTDVVGNCDVVEPGASGCLVPPGDVVALADAVSTLLRDERVRTQFVTAARQRVAEHFGIDRMGNDLRVLYDEMARITDGRSKGA